MGSLGTKFEDYSLGKVQYISYVPVQSGTDLYSAQRVYMEGSISVGTVAIGAVELKDDITTDRARIIVGTDITGTTKSLAVAISYGTINNIGTLDSITNTVSVTGTVSTTECVDVGTATYGTVAVANTASLIVASGTNRQSLLITNDSGSNMWVGTDNTLGTASGYKLYNHETFSPNIDDDIYGIVAAGVGTANYWLEV